MRGQVRHVEMKRVTPIRRSNSQGIAVEMPKRDQVVGIHHVEVLVVVVVGGQADQVAGVISMLPPIVYSELDMLRLHLGRDATVVRWAFLVHCSLARRFLLVRYGRLFQRPAVS